MKVDVKKFENKLNEIQKIEKISNKQIAEIMGLDYSYIFRIFKGETKTYSSKFINGIEQFCSYYNLDTKDYIFLE